MAFLGINYMEPGYTSKFGSEALQQKYTKTPAAVDTKGKKDSFVKHKKLPKGKILAGLAGAAFLIYGIKNGKINFGKIFKGAKDGATGVAEGGWKLLRSVGRGLGHVANKLWDGINFIFKGIGGIFSGIGKIFQHKTKP